MTVSKCNPNGILVRHYRENSATITASSEVIPIENKEFSGIIGWRLCIIGDCTMLGGDLRGEVPGEGGTHKASPFSLACCILVTLPEKLKR